MLAAGGLPGKTILCANDRLAFGVMAAAYSRGPARSAARAIATCASPPMTIIR